MHISGRSRGLLSFCLLLLGTHLRAQTTQGIIDGRVLDEVTSRGIAGAEVIVSGGVEGSGSVRSITDNQGAFSFASLDPGVYNLRVTHSDYRASEVRELSLPISGLVYKTLRLRLLSDLWQTGLSRSVFTGQQSSIVPIYGPDIDLSRSATIERAPATTLDLAPSLSKEITREDMFYLPLEGRDPYALIVLQPNVTHDVSTLRGLGVSANGQRPSSTEFLLDGFENNNYLSTGVFAVLPPEAIQEYRVSINNFSAEFGGTSGYLANVVTRSSTNDLRAELYGDLTNQSWNAVDFQENLTGGPAPSQASSAGAVFGGPLRRDRIFSTSSLGIDRSSGSAQAGSFTLPTQTLLDQLQQSASPAGGLYKRFAAPIAAGASGFGEVVIRPPLKIDHISGLERVDFASSSGRRHSFVRVQEDRLSQPDFIWSPYPDFTSGLDQSLSGFAFSTVVSNSPHLTEEFRAAFTADKLGWNRAHPEIPAISVQGTDVRMGSPANYGFQNSGKTAEFSANWSFTRGAHATRWGLSYLQRYTASSISSIPVVDYIYDSAEDLGTGASGSVYFPASYSALFDSGRVVPPDNSRHYRYWRSSSYVQDSYRLSDQVVINFGLRYEYFAPPESVGSNPDTVLRLGSGSYMPERIRNIEVVSGKQVFDSDNLNFAPRIGFAYNVNHSGTLVVRGSYGIFYDRPFDNQWLNVSLNDDLPASIDLSGLFLNPLSNLSENLEKLFPNGVTRPGSCYTITSSRLTPNCPSADQTLFQPGLRTPYVQSIFGGIQKTFGKSVSADLDYAGSLGKKLLTTDIVNREVDLKRFNEQLGDINYRANQGYSSHHAMIGSLGAPEILPAECELHLEPHNRQSKRAISRVHHQSRAGKLIQSNHLVLSGCVYKAIRQQFRSGQLRLRSTTRV